MTLNNNTREVPAPAVIQATLDDLNIIVEAMYELSPTLRDHDEDAFTRALGVLEYRRNCLVRWTSQQ